MKMPLITDRVEGMDAPPAIIATLSGATVRYDSHAALAGVSLDITRSAVTVVVGHNGSGKSTLLGVLAGTTPLESGSLTWRGFDAAPGRVAFVPQHALLPEGFPMTVGAAVAMGRWVPGASRPRILSRAKRLTTRTRGHAAMHHDALVEDAIGRLGLSHLRGRLLGQLSGGQRQRTLLAQGIAQGTDVLLLDEPTAGVDDESRARIADCLAALAGQGKTVVVASHDAQEIGAADAVVALRDGRVIPGGLDGPLRH